MENTQLQIRHSDTPSESEFTIMLKQSEMLVKTNFLPQSIKTKEQALAIILTGRELGIPAMAALNTINVIQNKPTVSPQLMLALIERSGQLENIEIKSSDNSVTCTMKRKNRSPHSETFGHKEASALNLISKDNYKKQPMTMYRWRAVASCARVVFPDVILGLYTPDEMGAETTETGEFQPTDFQTNPIDQNQDTPSNPKEPEVNWSEKIAKGKQLIADLGGKVKLQTKNQTDEDYYNYLVATYKALKQAPDALEEPETIDGEVVEENTAQTSANQPKMVNAQQIEALKVCAEKNQIAECDLALQISDDRTENYEQLYFDEVKLFLRGMSE